MSFLLKWALIAAAIGGALAYDYQLGRNHEYPLAYAAGETHGKTAQKATDDGVVAALAQANAEHVKTEIAQGLKDSQHVQSQLEAQRSAAQTLADSWIDRARRLSVAPSNAARDQQLPAAAGTPPSPGAAPGSDGDRQRDLGAQSVSAATADCFAALIRVTKSAIDLFNNDAAFRTRDDDLKRIYP